ncbi:hypothetical protein GCM10009677_17510 [Sphaerisporangium rubeum]|uniref:Radical SAM core domain-containing protein n=1 Tax=Sphaerisporangium rubeum TaxID=321317 RepID=A0A7X0MA91_9ACTN|nr:FxsB family cyclophane-forming radical SAM/SPASM peptide maturase [Sphaerisporangium rubeum]MBB6475834.1 uncharacterized protein [Sphaerisporangium rubeum]
MPEWPADLNVGELMASGWRPTPFQQFILKIHSRCDLACSYCYMYEMADTSWKRRPKRMPTEVVAAAAARIAEHTRTHGLSSVEVVLHGGEPLLAGTDAIRDIVTRVRAANGTRTRVDFTVQTNGTLLGPAYLRLFDELGIRVGVSLDGDRDMHDRNRRFAGGRGSHAAVTQALRLLTGAEYRHLFGGLLCTIDLRNDPIATYEALLAFDPPSIDFLLPHGNWSAPPPGRAADQELRPYGDWLTAVFDHWHRTRPRRTSVRMLTELINLLLGGESSTEQLGLSPAAMVVIETDGAIEQSDFLRSAYEGATDTGLTIFGNSLDEVLLLPGFAARQIGEQALSPACAACSVKSVCGGGLYAHRYREGQGFANPSVYCPDLLHLIGHVRKTIEADPPAGSEHHRRSEKGSTMKVAEHRISAGMFSAIATGGGGTAAISHLRDVQHSKHILLVRAVMAAARASDHPDAALTRRAYDLLATIQRHHPDVVDRVLRHPAAGAWARQTIIGVRGNDPSAAPAQLAGLAASAAILSGTVCDIDVPAVHGVVTLPGLGQASLSPTVTTATVQCHAHGAEVTGGHMVVTVPEDPHTDGPGWTGLRDLSATADGHAMRIVIDDLDPYRMPGVANLGGRLTSAEVRQWQTLLDDAWRILVHHHHEVAEEVAGAITVFTPLKPPARGQSSATSRETFGCIALSTPPDPTTMAVTLAHETQHAKLSALLDLVPMTKPDDGSRFYAPWRDDPRPVSGLLQGAYAYLGVTDFWRRQRRVETGESEVHAAAEFSRWRASAHAVTRTLLGSGRLTAPGEHFTSLMAERLEAWRDESVADAASALAMRRAERHLTAWNDRNR